MPKLAGDGRTDDTAALQQAIDSGLGHIELSKGTYRLTKSLVVDLDKVGFTSFSGHGVARLVMAGAGPAIHFKGTHEGSAAPEDFKPNVWDRQRMPQVDGLEIIGAHAEADGIEATGTMQLTITRTTVRDCRHAIHLTVRNRNILITDCHLYHNRGIGVFYDNVNLHQSNIVGSHISYNAGGGVVSHGGNVRNLHIGTCDIESNMSSKSTSTANVWLDSTGGSIGEVAITGCTIQHSSKAPDCANIRIQGAGSDPALLKRGAGELTREGHITIGNNIFSDIQINIHVQDARGVTITGNTFWEGFQHDLLVERSSNIVVIGNNFDRNPRYLVNGFAGAENNGLTFKDCRDSKLGDNVISGVWRKRAAVDLQNCERFNVTGNTILDNDGIGLLLEDVAKSLISNNLIRDDRDKEIRSQEPALKVQGGSENLIGTNALKE
jgi:parallel beta-helix repeat protein